MQQFVRVQDITQKDERTLCVAWTDGSTSDFDVVELRRRCPCALCVDENTGIRTLKADAVSESIRPARVDSVGRYAMSIRYSDGHTTGIYTFDYLRQLADRGKQAQ